MNVFQDIAADWKIAVQDAQAAWTFVKTQGTKIIAWVDKNIPGAQVALANLITTVDQSAGVLAGLAEQGFADIVQSHIATMETEAANLISASGLSLQGKTSLSAAETATLSTINTILQNGGSVALANVLSKLAPGAVNPAQQSAPSIGVSSVSASVVPKPAF